MSQTNEGRRVLDEAGGLQVPSPKDDGPAGELAEAYRTSVEHAVPFGRQSGCSRFGAQLVVEAAGAPVGVEQTEQIQRNERVGERGHEVIGRVVALHDELANVAPRGAEHEKRVADGGRQPESAAKEHA